MILHKIKIRPPVLADVMALTDLIVENCITEVGICVIKNTVSANVKGAMSDSSNMLFDIATLEGTVIAYGLIRYSMINKINEVEVVCNSKYQGQGVGSTLMRNLLCRSDAANRDFVAKVRPSNLPCIKMLQGLGFGIAGENVGYLILKKLSGCLE